MCAGIGIASADLGYDLHDWGWGIPRFGGIVLAVIAEQLDQLREVHVQAERIGNASSVVLQPVRGDLRSAVDAAVQVTQESSRILPVALANVEGGNQFRFGVNRNKHPLHRQLPANRLCERDGLSSAHRSKFRRSANTAGCRFRILECIRAAHRSPARTSRRMIVFRSSA